jgi:hypothetical protein
MQLVYDPRDDAYHERHGSRILYWLDDLGAVPLPEADPTAAGFLFTGARPIEDYRALLAGRPRLRDRPQEREPLLRLDSVLQTLEDAGVSVPAPRTWALGIDEPLPTDLTFPLFVRTADSSWKKGGLIARVQSAADLEAEAAALRRALGWDAVILARQWLDLAPAGQGRYGPVPREVRIWVVDGVPRAWSFHHLHIIPKPDGFPLGDRDQAELARLAGQVGSAFRSRLVAADFALGLDGRWWFIEAGPGSCAGTAHEGVFKIVAGWLRGDEVRLMGDAVGGPL